MDEVTLLDFIQEFTEKLTEQLVSDQKRWGDTWKHRYTVGQEERIFEHLMSYYDQYKHGGNPIPWLKVAGLALIAWVRENHPEVLIKNE